jgi:hypothetical protein
VADEFIGYFFEAHPIKEDADSSLGYPLIKDYPKPDD